MNRTLLLAGTTLTLGLALAQPVMAAETAATPAVSGISGLGVRNIGSAEMSGRIAALDAIQEKDGKVTLYVGAASGGVWKSEDGGTTFQSKFDKQGVQSIGALTIDPSNPRTIWVGTG
ncbi:MAG: WD40/YVTN/BNR-like repeat-containing protein, partial [Polymorphobacter sp.]